jgi:hypothetical protein
MAPGKYQGVMTDGKPFDSVILDLMVRGSMAIPIDDARYNAL